MPNIYDVRFSKFIFELKERIDPGRRKGPKTKSRYGSPHYREAHAACYASYHRAKQILRLIEELEEKYKNIEVWND